MERNVGMWLLNDGSFAARGGAGWVTGRVPGKHYCAGPSCPGFSYKASELAHPPSCARTLEDTLRASVALNEGKQAMSKAEEAAQLLAAQREEIERELAHAIMVRDEAQDDVKRLRDALAKCPRLHVPRVVKSKPKIDFVNNRGE